MFARKTVTLNLFTEFNLYQVNCQQINMKKYRKVRAMKCASAHNESSIENATNVKRKTNDPKIAQLIAKTQCKETHPMFIYGILISQTC